MDRRGSGESKIRTDIRIDYLLQNRVNVFQREIEID